MNKKKKTSLVWLWLTIAVIGMDQASKFSVMKNIAPYHQVKILSFFSLTLGFNKGAAFSFLNSLGNLAVYLFSVVAIVISIILIVWLHRLPRTRPWMACALALILGGAIGNVIDRIIHGCVIDFLLFHVDGWAWPAFNLADSAITIGAIMLLIDVIFFKNNSESDKK